MVVFILPTCSAMEPFLVRTKKQKKTTNGTIMNFVSKQKKNTDEETEEYLRIMAQRPRN